MLTARLGIASAVVHNDDDLFEWFIYWLDRQPALRRVRDVRASLANSRSDCDDDQLHALTQLDRRAVLTAVHRCRIYRTPRSVQAAHAARKTARLRLA